MNKEIHPKLNIEKGTKIDPVYPVFGLANKISTQNIADAPNGVSTAKINDGAVTTPKIADAPNGVTSAKISDDAISTNKLADAPNGVSSVKINDGAVTTPKIADAPNGVSNAKINDGVVTTPKIANAPYGVTREKINNGAITTGKIANAPYGVTRAKISNGAISTNKILGRAVTRNKIEYPKVDVNFVLLAMINKLQFGYAYNRPRAGFITVDSFGDKAVETAAKSDLGGTIGRWVDASNTYVATLDHSKPTKDYFLDKIEAGYITRLGVEAVDIKGNTCWKIKLSWEADVGMAYREDMETSKFCVMDSVFTTGKWGARSCANYFSPTHSLLTYLRPYGSPAPRVLRYFEVPVIGSGTEKDPFRAKMPVNIRKHEVFGNTNPLALTHSSVIKTGKDGKPVDYRTIVRIFEQPDRQKHLYSIKKSLDALKAQKGVTKLTKAEAIKEVKKLDNKLMDKDLRFW